MLTRASRDKTKIRVKNRVKKLRGYFFSKPKKSASKKSAPKKSTLRKRTSRKRAKY
jgi:hypothetical protein